jgi:hypothetical protein
MPKQTVEEKLDTMWPLSESFSEQDTKLMSLWRSIFLAGAQWQREQGIDWVSVETPPKPIKEHTYCWLSNLILVSDGYIVKPTRAVFSISVNRELIGYEDCSITPTHWAYITLPKTEK